MQLTINGEERVVENVETVADLLALFELDRRLVVIEYNGVIISRETYPERLMEDGDCLEIVQMMAGG
jgi:sulfur carrier protein